ncbi:TetR/AcrR family transcriptional regulator [Plantactinospora sp. GCM10030261]|uniref:TetR/AcrR family transcriptional regulator n=1 Tax=Plantactinospora sp. GCM10030261 TaxID=3273420 RepID=UPI00360CC27E
MGVMPKRVDHQQRRTAIADALMRVAARQGLEAVSLRHVAAEAGVTAGMVQHYFRTKDQMMSFVLDAMRERYGARMSAALDRLGPEPAPRTLLRTMFTQMLPVDEQSRADGRVTLAFLAYTAVRPDAAAPLREDNQAMFGFIAGLIGAAWAAEAQPPAGPGPTDGPGPTKGTPTGGPGPAGGRPHGADPGTAAIALMSAVEGLSLYLLGDHCTPDAALAALDAQLDLVLGPAEK